MSDVNQYTEFTPYGDHMSAYVNVYSKREKLSNLLVYLNFEDTIADLKQRSPGIQGQFKVNAV